MRLLISLFALLLLTACEAGPPAPSPPKPSWHWEWAGATGSGTSEQFSKDKYACLQDYRMTQSPALQPRDALTELRFMGLHQDVCLESKGWTKVQDGMPRPPTDGWHGGYWTPSGWLPLAPGMTSEWVWQGPSVEESAAATRFRPEKEACIREVGLTLPLPDPPTFTEQQGEAFMACMWRKNWATQPVPATPASVPR